ncbi:hypothetical protein MP228_012288 [Amoeboaphelidium protococcarum]|nr:hypothetical protein MP228_012288 [Amoeboaphelidium protococcarum]
MCICQLETQFLASMLNGDKMLSLLLASRQGQDYLSQCVFWNAFLRLKPIDLENDFSVQEWAADFLVALHERVGCDGGDKFFKKPITAHLLENIADRMSILNIHHLIQIYGFSKDLVFSGQPIESAKLLSSIAVRLTDTLKRDFELYGDDDVMKINTAQALGNIYLVCLLCLAVGNGIAVKNTFKGGHSNLGFVGPQRSQHTVSRHIMRGHGPVIAHRDGMYSDIRGSRAIAHSSPQIPQISGGNSQSTHRYLTPPQDGGDSNGNNGGRGGGGGKVFKHVQDFNRGRWSSNLQPYILLCPALKEPIQSMRLIEQKGAQLVQYAINNLDISDIQLYKQGFQQAVDQQHVSSKTQSSRQFNRDKVYRQVLLYSMKGDLIGVSYVEVHSIREIIDQSKDIKQIDEADGLNALRPRLKRLNAVNGVGTVLIKEDSKTQVLLRKQLTQQLEFTEDVLMGIQQSIANQFSAPARYLKQSLISLGYRLPDHQLRQQLHQVLSHVPFDALASLADFVIDKSTSGLNTELIIAPLIDNVVGAAQEEIHRFQRKSKIGKIGHLIHLQRNMEQKVKEMHPKIMQRIKSDGLPVIADYVAAKMAAKLEMTLRCLILSASSIMFGSDYTKSIERSMIPINVAYQSSLWRNLMFTEDFKQTFQQSAVGDNTHYLQPDLFLMAPIDGVISSLPEELQNVLNKVLKPIKYMGDAVFCLLFAIMRTLNQSTAIIVRKAFALEQVEDAIMQQIEVQLMLLYSSVLTADKLPRRVYAVGDIEATRSLVNLIDWNQIATIELWDL